VTASASKFRRELSVMMFPQIQGGHGWAGSFAVALNLQETVGGSERNGDIPVAATGAWATRMSPFQLA
jgi:hypothetical protein